MQGVARVPGACGELVQGMVDGHYFLITCPISIAAQVKVTLKTAGWLQGPEGKSKALEAVQLTLEYLGRRSGALVEINNPLTPGKGLASSTADVVGAIAATATALGAKLSLAEIKKIALAIEPTDGTFFPGIVLFDHLGGKRCEYLGEPPPLDILIIDPGGTIDTVLFNQRQDLDKLNRSREDVVRQATKLVMEGLARGQPELIAQGATLSALTNQKILHKPELETIWELASHCGALGINTAHSGTVIGILYRSEATDVGELEQKIKATFPYINFIRAAITSGGVEVKDKKWPLAR